MCVAETTPPPVQALGPHVAALGVTFYVRAVGMRKRMAEGAGPARQRTGALAWWYGLSAPQLLPVTSPACTAHASC